MNHKDAMKMIESKSAELVKIYNQSKNKEYEFRSLTTGDQRMLAKSSASMDDYNADIIRFGLFDKMLIPGDSHMVGMSKQLISSELTVVDMISFMASLKLQLGSDVEHQIDCPVCDDENDIPGIGIRRLNLQTIIENCKNFENQRCSVEMTYKDVEYKFILGESAWFDVVILREAIKGTADSNAMSSMVNFAFNNTCLYIKDMFIGGEQVLTDDNKPFCKMSVPDRVSLFDNLPPMITIDDKNKESLLSIVYDKFNTKRIQENIFGNDPIKCPKCGAELGGVLTYDTFFTL